MSLGHHRVSWWPALLLACSGISAHTVLRAPPGLIDKVGFDQHIGALVPQDVLFKNSRGASARLGDLLANRATVLVPAYYSCASLCSVVRAGIANAVAHSGLRPGRDFTVLLVSFDPRESPADALAAQNIDAGGRTDADPMRFEYLTGPQDSINALMKRIGFRYVYDPRNEQFDHDAGIVLLTPSGEVAQYFFGVQFQPEALRLALVNASHGRIGNIVDHFLLLCCDYDVSTGRYSLTIQRVLSALAIATVLALAALVVLLLHAEARRRRNGKIASTQAAPP